MMAAVREWSRCPYCGARCRGATCAAHADLVRIESGGSTRHGTKYSYARLGCRCERCTKANTDAQRKYNRSRGMRPLAQYLAEVTGHGAAAYKRRGCRCEVCRAAMAAQKRRQRANNAEYRERQNAARRARHQQERAPVHRSVDTVERPT